MQLPGNARRKAYSGRGGATFAGPLSWKVHQAAHVLKTRRSRRRKFRLILRARVPGRNRCQRRPRLVIALNSSPSLKRSYILLFPGALAARERRSHGGAKRPIQPSAPPLIDLQAKIPIDFRSQGPAGVRWAITSTGTYHDPYRRPGTRRHKCRKATATAGSGKIFDRTAGPARRPAGAWGWRVVSRTSRDPEEILPPASGRHLELMPASPAALASIRSPNSRYHTDSITMS